MRSNIFDRLAFAALSLVLILLPIFCLPFTSIGTEISKSLLLVTGLALGFVFWAIARFFDGKIVIPKSALLISAGGIVVAVLLSALMSANSPVSFFGTMLDIGSFWFIFSGFALLFLCSVVFRTSLQAKVALFGMIISSVMVIIFQSFHLFFPQMLSLGILGSKTANLVGSWNSLGLFAGFASLMFMLWLEFFPISRAGRIAVQLCLVLSILLAAAVNFPLVWILVGVSALLILVYKASTSFLNREAGSEKKFPFVSFVVVIVSLLFIISGGFIGNFIPNYFQIANTEVSPSLGSTFAVAKNVLVKDPVFGLGPNRFGEAWAMYKPVSVNGSAFWDTYFESGSGLLPTLLATTGAVGFLAWVIFLSLFLKSGARSVFTSIKDGVNWEMVAFFVLALYLYVSMFFYPAGPVIFLLALAFSGVFIGLLSSQSREEWSVTFLDDHRKSFFSILTLIILIIFSVAATFKFVERFASVSFFGKALASTALPEAEASISKALSLHTNDLYLRTYSQIYLVKLGSLAGKGSALTETEKGDLQASFDQAIRAASLAVDYNSANYLNYKLLGSVYQTAGTLGVEEGYSKAAQSFAEASRNNPSNPGLKLLLANVYFLDGKLSEAKNEANLALSLKPNYIDALLTLSQISKKEGNNTEALRYAEQALALAPTNTDLIQYVNTFKGTPAPVPSVSDEGSSAESNQ
jgi:tetratricopeptide (TPR) repeat protein